MLLQARPTGTIVAQNLTAPTFSTASATSGHSDLPSLVGDAVYPFLVILPLFLLRHRRRGVAFPLAGRDVFRRFLLV